MGQKTNPIGFRLAVNRNWQSRWFASKKDFPGLLLEDQIIRTKLMEKLKQASVPRIFIERASNRVRVKIFTARPGIVIGRKGQEIEKIKDELAKLTGKEILLDIQEVKKPEIEAQLVAENVALQLERRIAFRRAMKKAVEMAMTLGAEGIQHPVLRPPGRRRHRPPRVAAQGQRPAAHPPREHRLRLRRGPHPLRQDRRQMLDLQKGGRPDQLTPTNCDFDPIPPLRGQKSIFN